MSLRDKLQRPRGGSSPAKKLYETFGVLENPFPASGQPTGHPRLDSSNADESVVSAIRKFERDNSTQVLVIEGTQGVGKTNLLNYYQEQLQELYQEDKTFYVIRYYPDPEPTFDAIVRRVFQELGESHLIAIGAKLYELDDADADRTIEMARGHEIRLALRKLRNAAESDRASVASVAMEWLTGLRLLNRHRDALGVNFRLDTVESKTQALRDIVFVSEQLGLLKGIFLLLDELEKQDYSLSKTPVLRYLSAIRALIDALPKRLFLMLALTGEARRRYFGMLPAIASRLQNRITLTSLQSTDEGIALAEFYVQQAQERANASPTTSKWTAGQAQIIAPSKIKSIFTNAIRESADRAVEGVTHRDFLNRLHNAAEQAFSETIK